MFSLAIPEFLAPWLRRSTTALLRALGLAYSPGCTDGWAAKLFGGPGKTSIRSGGGLYYTAIEDVTLFNEVGDAPFGFFWVSPVPVYLEEPYKSRTDPPSTIGNRFPFTIPKPGATGIWRDVHADLRFSHVQTQQQASLCRAL